MSRKFHEPSTVLSQEPSRILEIGRMAVRMKNLTKSRTRSDRGQAIAEMAMLLMAFFIFLSFPLMNLGAIGMRACFVMNSAKVAAEKASKSLTFRAPAPIPAGTLANNVPAETVAQAQVQNYLNSFNGARVLSIKVGIVDIDNLTGAKVGPIFAPMTQRPRDGHTYYINGGLLGSIPGLTAPLKLTTHGERVFENPKGLML
jgi:hypothetical protein